MNKNGVEKLITLKNEIEKIQINNKNIECKVFGTGSTPGCSNPVEEFQKLTEIHPGNYCFYDYFQGNLSKFMDHHKSKKTQNLQKSEKLTVSSFWKLLFSIDWILPAKWSFMLCSVSRYFGVQRLHRYWCGFHSYFERFSPGNRYDFFFIKKD